MNMELEFCRIERKTQETQRWQINRNHGNNIGFKTQNEYGKYVLQKLELATFHKKQKRWGVNSEK